MCVIINSEHVLCTLSCDFIINLILYCTGCVCVCVCVYVCVCACARVHLCVCV